MSFKVIFKQRISNNGKFKKDITVSSFGSPKGDTWYYIDLRLLIVNEEGQEIFTKKGVTLWPEDMKKIDEWLQGFPYADYKDLGYDAYRHVFFTPDPHIENLFLLEVVYKKTDKPEKKNGINLTMNELEEINKVREQIVNLCNI